MDVKIFKGQNENVKKYVFTKDDTDYTALFDMQSKFLDAGYNVRVFDPAGKDDIGGGCGQLWYVQDWLKKYKGGNNVRN